MIMVCRQNCRRSHFIKSANDGCLFQKQILYFLNYPVANRPCVLKRSLNNPNGKQNRALNIGAQENAQTAFFLIYQDKNQVNFINLDVKLSCHRAAELLSEANSRGDTSVEVCASVATYVGK